MRGCSVLVNVSSSAISHATCEAREHTLVNDEILSVLAGTLHTEHWGCETDRITVFVTGALGVHQSLDFGVPALFLCGDIDVFHAGSFEC